MEQLTYEQAEIQRLKERVAQLEKVEDVFRTAWKGKASRPSLVAFSGLSDLHAGAYVRSHDTGNVTTTTFQDFLNRLDLWAEKTIRVIEDARQYANVETWEIGALGDYVEGETIFLGQPHHIDRSVAEQVEDGGVALARAINKVYRETRMKNARLTGVIGNHGRPGRKGEYDGSSSWDRMFLRRVEDSLSDTSIEVRLSASPHAFYRIPEIPRYTWLLLHGDSLKANGGMPYYGADRMLGSWSMILGTPVDYLWMGHWHRTAGLTQVRSRIFFNGSLVPGTDYTVNQFQGAHNAQQTMVLVHPHHGVVSTHDLVVEELKPLQMDEQGYYTPLLKAREKVV